MKVMCERFEDTENDEHKFCEISHFHLIIQKITLISSNTVLIWYINLNGREIFYDLDYLIANAN